MYLKLLVYIWHSNCLCHTLTTWNSAELPSVVDIRRIAPRSAFTVRIPTIVILISQPTKPVCMWCLGVPALTRVPGQCHSHSSKVFLALGVVGWKAFQCRCSCGQDNTDMIEIILYIELFSPRVISALLHLQIVSPRFQFGHT